MSGKIEITSGPVAQLGARFHGMEEVVGSIPTRSTKPFSQLQVGSFWCLPEASSFSFGIQIPQNHPVSQPRPMK
jgi:hypothetical protein